MTRLFRFMLVPLMLLALSGCQATEKTTCCGSCGKSVAAQKCCHKAKTPCEKKKASKCCHKKKDKAKSDK